MSANSKPLHRRDLLKKGAALAASLAALPLVPAASSAAKADKAMLNYQDQPRNGKTCADCWAYVPGPNTARGACKAVEGPVSALGWCMAYSPKRKH